ncbi:putative lipoprotein [Burkholderia cenocepacia K56-2Valvano]|nr:putative lipoprotein [Burkholderia cenocepacia K56-2Valvano]
MDVCREEYVGAGANILQACGVGRVEWYYIGVPDSSRYATVGA